jgi:alpha-beta hydrolase superfamily lysophospholipase
MKSEHFVLKARDGKDVYVRNWLPEGKAKAIVLVAHGMAEHGARYERFATKLTADGYVVYAPDHRGHGKTAASEAELGWLGDKDGFFLMVEDLHEVGLEAKKRNPELPVHLFGHSMGSFISQAYIALHGEELASCVLSGTSGPMPAALLNGGKFVASLGCLFKGPRSKAPLANKLSFGSYNDAFKPNRTEFDWLSRDNVEVDKYVADPFCGFICTYGFFRDFLKGLSFIHKPATMTRIPKKLPLYLVSGSKDPVGAATGAVDNLAGLYKTLGLSDVEVKLYEGGRHEILNETNRDEVMADVLSWLGRHQARN